MKYLVTYKQYNRLKAEPHTLNSLKEKCISLLNNRGWDNKDKVDLRSIKSMAEYLYENVVEISIL